MELYPEPPTGCADVVAAAAAMVTEAARLWLSVYGPPASRSVADATFMRMAERLLWEQAQAMGLAVPR